MPDLTYSDQLRIQFCEDAWRWAAGLPTKHRTGKVTPAMLHAQWSFEFETLMRNRMHVGMLRYGTIKGAATPKYNHIKRMVQCIHTFEETGNLECLVDLANMAMLEFVRGTHPKRHFAASDDGQHTEALG